MKRSSYVIQWRSKVNGRAGQGTKEFDRAEAEELAKELNQEYPQIWHEPVAAPLKTETEEESKPEDSYVFHE
jgi:hypothetical protein